MNVIKNGFVRTDFVHNELYKAYVIERAQFSNLRITVSGNHQEIAPTSPDSGLVEITYEIVYSYANLGPWCNTCYRSQTGARNVSTFFFSSSFSIYLFIVLATDV